MTSKNFTNHQDRRYSWILWGAVVLSALLGAATGVALFGLSGLIPGFMVGWVAIMLIASVGFLMMVLRMPLKSHHGRPVGDSDTNG